MRRSLSLALALSFPGLALPACSALGLDHLPQADCMQGSGGVSGDDFCASLADHMPPGACLTWQCNESSHHCEQLPTDADRDGAPSMMCAMGAAPDCDDGDAHNHPGGTETCNGLDENCDGIADDGAIVTSLAPASLTTINAAPDQLALTYQPDADEAFLLARYGATHHTVTITGTTTPTDLAFTQTGTGAIITQIADGAIAALGGARYAVLTRRTLTAGCQQWALFPVASASSAATLRAADQSLLPVCPTSGTQQITAPAIAGHGNGASAGETLLVAWLAGADGARSCGAAPPLPVSLAGATFDTRSTATNRVGADVVTLGMSVDNGPPAVLALDDGFLVAYARSDMTIAVHLITVTADATGVHLAMPSATPAYVEPAGAMTPQGVSLSRGATASGATSIALSYYAGCGGSNPITVRMLTRNAAAITGSGTPATNIGTGLARSRVQVVYQPRSNEWLVGWRSASGLGVQRLFHDGATEGAAFDVVSSMMVSAFVLEPLATGPLYRAVVVDGTAVNQVTFGCAP